jgi:DNA-binding NarL/FixJ family response regulator
VTIRAVIADDQSLVRSGLAMILDTQPDITVVAQADDGVAALHEARSHRPDIVLMDIRMPGVDGLTATKAITADPALAKTKIVILTTYDLDEYLFSALRAGAAGFLLKGVTPEELIRAVREIAAGGCLLGPSPTRRLIAEFVGIPPKSACDIDAQRRINTLTPRETEVLTLMAGGLTNGEIATTLVIGENTAKTHVGHILDKLHARDRVQAVIIAYQAGLADRGLSTPAQLRRACRTARPGSAPGPGGH